MPRSKIPRLTGDIPPGYLDDAGMQAEGLEPIHRQADALLITRSKNSERLRRLFLREHTRPARESA